MLIKYIKSVIWTVAKRLSYIQDARCLKVNSKTRDQSCNILKSKFLVVHTGICADFPPGTSIFLLFLSVSLHVCSIPTFLLSEGQAGEAQEPLTKVMLFQISRSSEGNNISMLFTASDKFLDTLVQDRIVLKVFVSMVTNIRFP